LRRLRLLPTGQNLCRYTGQNDCRRAYKHLSAEERAAIMIEKGRNTSISAIARLLGRSASTITRELARNRAESPRGYDATSAALAYRTRRARSRRQPKLAVGNALYWQVHHDLVYRRWTRWLNAYRNGPTPHPASRREFDDQVRIDCRPECVHEAMKIGHKGSLHIG
ncbi:hypothetical protein DF039_37650, partial [Burkholderia cenocepacia]